LRAQAVSGCQVQRVIALQHIEGAAIGRYTAQHSGNVDIRVGIAIAVGVGREVVCNQIVAHRDVLGDGFAVVSSHAGRKILRCLDAAGCGLNGQAGIEIGAPGRPGLASSNSSRTITFCEGSGEISVTSLTSAVTITSSAATATCSIRNVRFANPALKSILRVTVSKPTASTRTVQAPRAGRARLNRPSPPVLPFTRAPPAKSNSMRAPATGLPTGSNTVPQTVAAPVCAAAV